MCKESRKKLLTEEVGGGELKKHQGGKKYFSEYEVIENVSVSFSNVIYTKPIGDFLVEK